MQLKTTDIGIQAVIDYHDVGGIRPNIIWAKIGVQPTVTLPPPVLSGNQSNGTSATDIYGQAPASDFIQLLSLKKIDNDTLQYTLRLDNTLGDYDITNIGLYTADPAAIGDTASQASAKLFAIGVLDSAIYKEKLSTTTEGNVFDLKIRVSFGGASVVLQWEINPVVSAELLELSSVDYLDTPTGADSNIYLINGKLNDGSNPDGLTDNSEAFIAFKKDTFLWSFSGYGKEVFTSSVTAATATSVSCSVLPEKLNFYAGRFLIQFTDGVHKGVVRAVSSFDKNTNTIIWKTSTAAPVAVGTNFVLICSNFYARSASKISTIDSVDFLPKATDTDSDMYNVIQNPLSLARGTDDANNGFLAFQNASDKSKWAFSNYKVRAIPLVLYAEAGSSQTQASSTFIADDLSSFSNGRYIVRFLSGANAGLVRVLTGQAHNLITWITPLPLPFNTGDSFEILVSDAFLLQSGGSGGGGGGGLGSGVFREETITAGVGGQTTFNLTQVSARYAIPFVGSVFQQSSNYTRMTATQIIFNFTIPEGVPVTFIECGQATAANGLPLGGSAGQILEKIDSNDWNAQWVDKPVVIGTKPNKVQLVLGATVTDVKLVPYTGNTIYIGGVLRQIPNSGVTLNIADVNNTIYAIFAEWDGTNVILSKVGYSSLSTLIYDATRDVILETTNLNKTFVGLVYATLASDTLTNLGYTNDGFVSRLTIRSYYNDYGQHFYGNGATYSYAVGASNNQYPLISTIPFYWDLSNTISGSPDITKQKPEHKNSFVALVFPSENYKVSFDLSLYAHDWSYYKNYIMSLTSDYLEKSALTDLNNRVLGLATTRGAHDATLAVPVASNSSLTINAWSDQNSPIAQFVNFKLPAGSTMFGGGGTTGRSYARIITDTDSAFSNLKRNPSFL